MNFSIFGDVYAYNREQSLLVPSKYIAFKNCDENIDFDKKMKMLQAEFKELLQAEEESKKRVIGSA
ncbi:hypothetical protein LJC05_01035 [Bacteroides sp. OttesenSCG-928-J23]|nr:hypothetical protein [Bacteroides sp. OttesenSCG-928-J23]MDL2304858.1 hypothetical protein [Bacteroides sp. OttesenSCG-928-D19]